MKSIKVQGLIPNRKEAEKKGKIAKPGYTQLLANAIVRDFLYNGEDRIEMTCIGAQAHSNALQACVRANYDLKRAGYRIMIEDMEYITVEVPRKSGSDKVRKAKAVKIVIGCYQ